MAISAVIAFTLRHHIGTARPAPSLSPAKERGLNA